MRNLTGNFAILLIFAISATGFFVTDPNYELSTESNVALKKSKDRNLLFNRQQRRRVRRKELKRQERRNNRLKAEHTDRMLSFGLPEVETSSAPEAKTEVVPQVSYIQESPNFEWLARNLTSIWQVLSRMHEDIKQIKRYHRLEENGSQKNKKSNHQEKKKTIKLEPKEEDCDPSFLQDRNNCLNENGTVCGDHGTCSCGECECTDSFYGYQCKCNDNNCVYTHGQICGGPDRGQCRCGACVCRPGFTGEACDCSTESSNCINERGQFCSNQGSCMCNRCFCNEGYSGIMCEDSIYSASMCERMKLCVLCNAFGKSYPQCADCNLKTTIVDKVEQSLNTCLMIHFNCILTYSYSQFQNADGSTNVTVQKAKDC